MYAPRVSPVLGVVIVTYYPDMDALATLVRRYQPQVQYVVVVDNTPGGAGLTVVVTVGVHLIELGENLGIGSALNRGITWLLQQGCDFVVLSDQDSLPPQDFVQTLAAAFLGLQARGRSVATVGALFVDPRTGYSSGFARDGWCGNGHHLQVDESGLVPASYVITSGSMVSREAIEDVGMMADDLFIDYVDMEWCFRAVSRGYEVYGQPAAVMQHTLGDKTASFWLFGWRQKGMHSPLRVYYQNRNILLLCRLAHVATYWKFWSVVKRPAAIFLYLLIARGQRLRYLRSALLGLLDGIRGRKGVADGDF